MHENELDAQVIYNINIDRPNKKKKLVVKLIVVHQLAREGFSWSSVVTP